MSEAQERISHIGLQNNYHRPNQDWDCGTLQFGCPCTHGPSPHGKCISSSECTPIKESDTWLCTRPVFRGGTCEKGPDEKGNCCQSRPVCTPKRSLRHRRRMFCLGLLTATIGLLMILLGTRPLQEVIVPGPLSSGHAELLMHQGADRCATCHANAHQSVGQWVGQWVGFTKQPSTTQTQLCMECHKATMATDTATFAHNQSPTQLRAKTQAVSRRPTTQVSLTDAFFKADFKANQEVSCSTCHREHHGTQVDMKAMTDLQCQSCHVESLGHFESSHPAFELTAQSQTPSIVFDHKTHGLKHFAQANQEFKCAACHRDDASGNVKQLVSYESACASCHDGPMKLNSQKGVVLLQLPMIDPDAIKAANVELGYWPSQLSADFDGKIEGMTRVLLEADPQARQAFYLLGEDVSWIDLDPQNAKQMRAVGDILLGLKRLLVDLSARGDEAIQQRMQVAFQRPLTAEEENGLGYGLSADLFRDARQRWFPNLLKEVDLERCFPVYGRDSREQQALTISNPIFGRLAPQFFQDLLAENPLAGQFTAQGTPSTVHSKSVGAASSPVAAGQQQSASQSSANVLAGSNSGQMLALNPLSGGTDRPLPISGGSNSEGRKASLASPAEASRGLPASSGSGGELLADNPLSGSVPSVATTESVDPTNVVDTTPDPPDLLIAAESSTVDQPFDSADDLQRVDAIIAKLRSDSSTNRGWARNDQTFSIRYQLSGHADPLLRSWIQMAANQRTDTGAGQQAALALFDSLASPQSVGTCMQCHVSNGELPATPVDHPDNLVTEKSVDKQPVDLETVDQDRAIPSSGGKIRLISNRGKRLSAPTQLAPYRQISATLEATQLVSQFRWQATYRDPMVRQFTNFNHRPHTLQTGLSDCQSCHQMIEPSATELTSEAKFVSGLSDFHPMTNQNCANCHRSGGTSDQCTTCHSYHVGSRRLK